MTALVRARIVAWVRAMGLALAVLTLAACPKPAKVPSADKIAGMVVSTIGLGVQIADKWCLARAQKMYDAGNKDDALQLAIRCDEQYAIARKALMAAAYAVDGWSDAKNHDKAICAITEATSALTYVVQLLRDAGVADVPREVSMAISAAAVLSEMVEAKACPLPTPAPKPAPAAEPAANGGSL